MFRGLFIILYQFLEAAGILEAAVFEYEKGFCIRNALDIFHALIRRHIEYGGGKGVGHAESGHNTETAS